MNQTELVDRLTRAADCCDSVKLRSNAEPESGGTEF